MKKHIFAITLVVTSLFSAVPTFAKWEKKTAVDDFGDETGQILFTDTVTGTFSNSATEDSELTVDLKFQLSNVGTILSDDINAFIFKIYEYNDNPANFYEKAQLTYKIGDDTEKYEDPVYAASSAGTLFTCNSLEKGCPSPLTYDIAKALCEGNVVKCLITDGNSKYRFDIQPDGFAEVYKPAIYEYIQEIEKENDPEYNDYESYSEAMATLGDYEDAEKLSEEYYAKYEKLYEEHEKEKEKKK